MLRKLSWLIAMLLSQWALAQTTTTFPAFVNGQSDRTTVTGAEQVPCISGTTTFKCTPVEITTYVNANASLDASRITGGTLSALRLPALSGDCSTPGNSGVLTCGSNIARTGTDINTSNQVTATHLASPLPVVQGGTGTTTSTGSGNVVLSTSPALTSPSLGTPSSLNLASANGFNQLVALSGATSVQQIEVALGVGTQNVPLQVANISCSGGPGVISRIWMTGTASDNTLVNTHIQVYVDGEATPGLDLIGSELTGLPLIPNLPATAIVGSTPNYEIGIPATAIPSISFKYPIPFSSSAKVFVNDTSFNDTNIYFNTEVQCGVSSTHRLRNVGSFNMYTNGSAAYPAWNSATAYVQGSYASLSGVNYIAVASNTNQTPPNATFWLPQFTTPGSQSGAALKAGTFVLAQVNSTSLWVVGMFMIAFSANATWMENSPMIYDQASGSPSLGTANYQSSGFEDFVDASYYFASHYPYIGGVSSSGTVRSTVSVGASPATYTNADQGAQTLFVTGGSGVTDISISRDGTTFDQVSAVTPANAYLAPGDKLRITYSVTAPTVAKYPTKAAMTQTSTNTLVVMNAWDSTAAGSPSPQRVAIFKDFLARSGGIRCANGLLMRFELPTGKSGTFGAGTTFGWNVLYYTP